MKFPALYLLRRTAQLRRSACRLDIAAVHCVCPISMRLTGSHVGMIAMGGLENVGGLRKRVVERRMRTRVPGAAVLGFPRLPTFARSFGPVK